MRVLWCLAWQLLTILLFGCGGEFEVCGPDNWCSVQGGPTEHRTLNSVFGADASNIWFVGELGQIFKRDDSGFSQQESGTKNNLYGVWGSDVNNVWAVGASGTILKGDYDPPIRTYTDLRMETSCQRPACPSQVMSLFRTFRT